jgi:hypothetical protein
MIWFAARNRYFGKSTATKILHRKQNDIFNRREDTDLVFINFGIDGGHAIRILAVPIPGLHPWNIRGRIVPDLVFNSPKTDPARIADHNKPGSSVLKRIILKGSPLGGGQTKSPNTPTASIFPATESPRAFTISRNSSINIRCHASGDISIFNGNK